MVKKQLLQTTS